MAEVVDPDVTPPTPAAIEPPVEPVGPPEPPVEPVDPDEAEAVELPAGKHVPLAALKAAREELKAAKAQLQQALPAAQWAQQNKPVMDFMLQQQMPSRPSVAAPAPTADPQLTELARALDYFKADGTPDLERAATFNRIIDTRAEQKARSMVEPVAGTLLYQASERNWYAAASAKLHDGRSINQNMLADAWRHVQQYPEGARILADPQAVTAIVSIVKQAQLDAEPARVAQPAPQGQPPVRTEAQGSTPRGSRVSISEAERSIVGTRMSDEQYVALTKDFRPGRPNVLED